MPAVVVVVTPVVEVDTDKSRSYRNTESFDQMNPIQIPLLIKSCSFLKLCGIRSSAPIIAFLVLVLPIHALAADEQKFATAQDAVNALVLAARTHDVNAMHAIFGSTVHDLVSPDLVQATEESDRFIQHLDEKTTLVNNSDSNATLDIGSDAWPFPIPLVKQDGKWVFDTAAGSQEILARRIGRDEMGAIEVSTAYVAAQREYASEDRMGDGVLAYAQSLHSTADKHDGLYWHSQPGEEISPLGPLIAQAHGEGYHHTAKILNDEQAPYHGYYFKILTSQGRHAPGGAYDYIINGRMIAGFALIAWPAEWGNTGVMTFIVNQQGKVYQKNLGPSTFDIAKDVTAYAPNDTWTSAQTDPVLIAQKPGADHVLQPRPVAP